MKHKFTLRAAAILLSMSILFSSCIGSFYLTRRLYAWNCLADNDKWVNELIFLALSACQVYTIAIVIDSMVLNTIEFWTGENPAVIPTRQVTTDHGIFSITTDTDGHKIQKEGSDEIIVFRFDTKENSWSLEAMGQTVPLLQFTGERQAKVYLADGSTVIVDAGQTGRVCFR